MKITKIFYVQGIRHHAIVIADNKDEAIKLSIADSDEEKDSKVIFGHIGEWEKWKNGISALELKLPKGYKIIDER